MDGSKKYDDLVQGHKSVTIRFMSAVNGAKFPIILTTFSYFLFRDSVLVLGLVGASVLSLSLITFPTELTFSFPFSRT